jgi:23S rRNA pseudouridine2457 synthase
VIIRFWKPCNVMPSFTDPDGRRTLAEFIKLPNVYAAGRLDYDSEGLLLLTDDGNLNHRLTDPRFEHPKTYLVQVERVPDKAALDQLRAGVTIQEYVTRPAQVELLSVEPELPPRDPPIRFRKNVPTAWLRLTITEGKNRQVRRMTAAVGFPTLRLVRVAIGTLTLDGLKPGEWQALNEAEALTLARSLRRRAR